MKTVIFDFGNVVGFFDHRKTLRRLAPFTDLSPEQMIARVYDAAIEDEFEMGVIGTPEALTRIQTLWQLRCDLNFLAESIADIFWPNPEVCGLIPQLRPHHRVLLGSNTNDIHARQFRRQFAGVLAHFDALVLSYEIGHRKPHPGFYTHCQSLAETSPEEVVFIDDLPANIEAAKTHGWNAILYRPENGLADQLRGLGVAV
jgi:putative hydrolase of the HAD superfamily